MNIKKAVVAGTMSVSLLIPGGIAFAADQSQDHMPKVDTKAVDLRADLDHLFSEHAFLAINAMRKGISGAKDYDATVKALNANTGDLTAAVASVYGDKAGEQFKKMWNEHIGYFVDYVQATAKKDEAGKQKALDNLSMYREKFSKFMDTATDGKLPAKTLADGLQMHVKQLIGSFDAYVAKDYQKSYEIENKAIEHMYMTSKGLSNAIVTQFPKKFDDSKAVTNAAELRSRLNFLFSEHYAFAEQAMNNGADGSDEFDASVAVLNENTEQLTAAIASVYGKEGGEQFKDFWSAHIGYFVDYVKASGAKDDAAKQKALDNLKNYRADFSKFIETTTDGGVDAKGLSDGLAVHVKQLTGQFDDYVAGNYDSEVDQNREGYHHMFIPAKLMSNAIVMQFPEKFSGMPDMPETGMGGMSQSSATMNWIIWSAPLFLLGGIFALRRKTASEQ